MKNCVQTALNYFASLFFTISFFFVDFHSAVNNVFLEHVVIHSGEQVQYPSGCKDTGYFVIPEYWMEVAIIKGSEH